MYDIKEMGLKKGTRKGAPGANNQSTVVPSEDLSDSTTLKRKREDEIINTTPEPKSTNSSINAHSTAGSEAQSTFSSISSTSSENQLVTSGTNHPKMTFKGKSYNQSHILFNSKKVVYLQDSLDPIDEASLQLNDDKVCRRIILLLG